VSGIAQATTARMSRCFQRGDIKGFRKILRSMLFAVLGIGAAMTAGAALFGDTALTLLYSPEYSSYQSLFVMIMVVAGVSYAAEIVRVGITAARQFKLQSCIYGGVLFLSCGVYPVLIPQMQLNGAAISMLIVAAIQLVVNLVVLYRITRERMAFFKGNAISKCEGV